MQEYELQLFGRSRQTNRTPNSRRHKANCEMDGKEFGHGGCFLAKPRQREYLATQEWRDGSDQGGAEDF